MSRFHNFKILLPGATHRFPIRTGGLVIIHPSPVEFVIHPPSKRGPPFALDRPEHLPVGQDKYKQPLKHLTGAEIGVYKGDHAKNILDFLNIEHLVLVIHGSDILIIAQKLERMTLFMKTITKKLKINYNSQ